MKPIDRQSSKQKSKEDLKTDSQFDKSKSDNLDQQNLLAFLKSDFEKDLNTKSDSKSVSLKVYKTEPM